ncbi:MAG: S8/S53 family peptidase, partial [Candidatus Eremiobacteraeota bacterium]|nr:S8/S53 family peptidase [Candidatus Eremiobacteraeota bacterium]
MLHPSLRAAAISALLLAPIVGALPASAANERIVGRAAATQPVHFFVKLPLRNRGELEQLISLQGTESSPLYHHFITPKQFAAEFGPTAASRARVETALRAEGVTIDRAGAQGYVVRAASAAVEKNFGVRMSLLRSANGRTHVATKDPVRMPLALSKEGAAVVGLAYLQPRHVYARRSAMQPSNRYSAVGDYYFADLKEAYDYPTYKDVRGRGVTIGVVISSDVLDSDTQSYFDHENFTKISHYPVPTVYRRYVEGGAPFDPNADASFEASLDVQQTLGSAPGATDLLYDIPDLGDDSILAGYLDVVEDNAADVISSSFGGCELDYTAAYNGGTDYTYILNIYDEIFAQGNAQGQTFLASSGDSSGLACPSLNYFYGQNGTFVPSVENPASDPHVTAVGGTDLVTTTPPSPQPSVPVLTSKYVRESEYGDPEIPYDVYGFGATVSGGYWGSGSGISTVFAEPAYQKAYGLKTKGRSVPDVSMQMGGCPFGISLSCNKDDSASILNFDGFRYGVIGTSASSPEFAGLLALRIAYGHSRLGNANTTLYELGTANDALPYHFYHQGIPGYNGVVTVKAGTKGYN